LRLGQSADISESHCQVRRVNESLSIIKATRSIQLFNYRATCRLAVESMP